jgi:hypothetical protein
MIVAVNVLELTILKVAVKLQLAHPPTDLS